MNEYPPAEERPAVPGSGSGPPTETPGMDPEEARRVVETLIFAADAPLALARLSELSGIPAPAIREAVERLNRQYEESGRTFRIHKVAQGFQFYTLPDYSGWVRTMYKRQFVHRLTKPSLEVLAIIAYKQPVTRPEIEKLRGVDCSGPILTLLERRLIATAGRARRPGSPFLYRTTREFLRYFGLEQLDDLPPLEDFGALLDRASAEEDTGPAGRSEHLAIQHPAEPESSPAEPPGESGPPAG